MGSSAVDTTLLVLLQRGVLTLTLNRPDRRNAIDPELRDARHDSIDAVAADADVHGVGEGLIGLAAEHGGLTRLVKLLGLARAKEVLLGGEDLDAPADVDQRSAMLAESFAQTALLQSWDHGEGLAAARERRDPQFRGARWR
jgi:enoyl-CoA hydratase/carnithine racemase